MDQPGPKTENKKKKEKERLLRLHWLVVLYVYPTVFLLDILQAQLEPQLLRMRQFLPELIQLQPVLRCILGSLLLLVLLLVLLLLSFSSTTLFSVYIMLAM